MSTNPPKPRGARWDETMVKLSQVVLGGGGSWWWVFHFLGLLRVFFSWRGAIFAEYFLRCPKRQVFMTLVILCDLQLGDKKVTLNQLDMNLLNLLINSVQLKNPLDAHN